MQAVTVILLILAFVCFALAAFNVSARINLVGLGLALWILTVLIPALASL
jgi:hypothetical protein